VIKASALLVALAIGLLVASVLASSLLMVYVSIGVCAVAALLLVAGVLSHWSEIFGRGEPRPPSMQESWSAPQVQVGTPVLATTQAAGAGPEDRRPRRENVGGPPSAPPVEVVVPQPEFPVAARGDDLWERVEEELGSGAKRDTGALSWPGTELPVPAESAGPPEQAGPPGTPPGGASAWIWGHGAGWHPPDTPDHAWPPPAAAFAGSPPRPEPATSSADSADEAGQDTAGSGVADPGLDPSDLNGPDPDSTRPADGEPASPEPARPAAASTESADTGRTAEAAGQPAPDAAAAVPSRDADEAAPGSPADETPGQVPRAAPVKAGTWDERPRWIISVGDATPARPVQDRAVPEPAASERTGEADTGEADTAEAATGEADTGEADTGEADTGEADSGEADSGGPANAERETAEPATSEREAGVPPAGEPEVRAPAVIAPATHEAPPRAAAGQEPASRKPAPDGPAADGPADREAVAEEPAAGRPAEPEAVAEEPAAGRPAEPEAVAEEPAAGRPAGQTAPGRVDVTVVPGVARYHRSECILIRFLGAGDLEIMSRQEAEEATFVPCRACQPDQLES
jgi:hypothetical protein